MRKLLLAGVAGVLSATGAYAAPINSSTTITNGGFTFSNFSCSTPTNNGATSAPASGNACSNLTVGAVGTSGIEFQGLLQALSATSATSSSSLDVVLGYQVTSATPFSTVTLLANGSASTDGTIAQAQIVESALTSQDGSSLGTTQVNNAMALQQSTLTLSPAQTSVYLMKDVSLSALGSATTLGSASFSFIDQTIGGTSGGSPAAPTPAPTPTPTPTPSAVPEPVSLALLGSGLVGLGLVRRAKRS